MGTPYSLLVDAFLRRVELDRAYFFYRDMDDSSALFIARQRAFSFLDEACSRIMLEGMPSVDFTLGDDPDGSFAFDLTQGERLLVTSLMLEAYMARDIARLKTLDVNFTGTELRVFDPSNARKTFLAMYESVKAQNESLLDTYRNTDRLSGKLCPIDYSGY